MRLKWVYERNSDLRGFGAMIGKSRDWPFGLLFLFWRWEFGFGLEIAHEQELEW